MTDTEAETPGSLRHCGGIRPGPILVFLLLSLLFKPVGFVLKLAAKSLLMNRVPVISYKDPAIWLLSPLFLQNTKSKPFIPTVTKLKVQRN